MQTDNLLGIWKGTAHNSNGWDMEITVIIPARFQAGESLGTYEIPAIPCAGNFRLLGISDQKLELRTEDRQGDCGPAESDSLTLQPDGSLLYVSNGDGWEARGILQRISTAP